MKASMYMVFWAEACCVQLGFMPVVKPLLLRPSRGGLGWLNRCLVKQDSKLEVKCCSCQQMVLHHLDCRA